MAVVLRDHGTSLNVTRTLEFVIGEPYFRDYPYDHSQLRINSRHSILVLHNRLALVSALAARPCGRSTFSGRAISKAFRPVVHAIFVAACGGP
jgi:hypothetical protein